MMFRLLVIETLMIFFELLLIINYVESYKPFMEQGHANLPCYISIVECKSISVCHRSSFTVRIALLACLLKFSTACFRSLAYDSPARILARTTITDKLGNNFIKLEILMTNSTIKY